MPYVATIQRTKGSHKIHTRVPRRHNVIRRPLIRLTESQKIALRWREMYGLPSIKGKTPT
jgi:hypothetical protein